MARVMLVGESWFVHSIHQKGFDSFTTSEYAEGGAEFCEALTAAGHEVTRIPAHRIEHDFPLDPTALRERTDVVVVSDVGANSFQLSKTTFTRSEAEPDRIQALADFVTAGGGLLMVGGYMTFSGIDAKARWGRTPLAPLLPVTVLDRDDRVEVSPGIRPALATPHPITDGLEPAWPALLGFNELVARDDAQLLASVGEHPLLAIGQAGVGRTAAFASDLAPHWASPAFLAWHGYRTLFDRTVRWLAGEPC